MSNRYTSKKPILLFTEVKYQGVQNVQNQILRYKKEQRLDFIAFHVFDIRNRIFSIDKVLNESKSSSYDQVGYSDLIRKSDKFVVRRVVANKFSLNKFFNPIN